MSEILKDIVDDMVDNIDMKPTKSRLIVKWTLRLSFLAIVFAFLVGQYKSKFLNKFDTIDNEIIELKKVDEKQDVLIKENHDKYDELNEKYHTLSEKIK